MISFKAEENYTAAKNTVLTTLNISDYIDSSFKASKAIINVGGWQSWNPGFEIMPDKCQERLTCHVVHQFDGYLRFPESGFKESKNIVLAPFVTYLRWENKYLVLASTGNIDSTLPPVQFVINRKKNQISVEICDKGKEWKKGELQCQIEVYTADSYFEAKDKLKAIFGSSNKNDPAYSSRFDQIQFLGKTSLGWESWYNHYSHISEKLIEDDLLSLKTTENFLKITDKDTKPVFQIDDGWEKGLGYWEISNKKFPNGLSTLTEKINQEGYVPGLWIAPFIIDLRTPIAQEHPDWLLRNSKGNLVPAGFNPLWGATGTFYVLDLSNKKVIKHLDAIMERAINEWGFRYIKLDFLYAGMLYGNYSQGGASYHWYSKAIEKLTSRKVNKNGEPVAYLGCGAPFELSFKNFPLSRIGSDTYEHWENKVSKVLRINGRNSAYMNLKDTLGHAMWDKIIFANDPDVIFIRKENCSLTKEEKLLIGTVNFLFGSQIMYSDDPAASDSEEERQLSKELNEIRKKYSCEEFSVQNTGKDSFEIRSKNGAYAGTISLGKEHKITIQEL